MLFFISILTGIIVLVVLALPFVLGKGGALQESHSVNSVERLERMREAILKRYLEDESAHQKKLISASVWKQRQQYLTNRFVDTSRRLDFLQHLQQESQQGGKV